MSKEKTKICQHCKTAFTTTNRRKNYCSDKCRSENLSTALKATKCCEKCNREISKSNFKKHNDSCDGTYFTGPNKLKTNVASIITNDCLINNLWVCPNCQQNFNSRTSLLSHYWLSHTENGIQHQDTHLYKLGSTHESFGNQFTSGLQTTHSDETKEKLRQRCLANPSGIALHPEWRSASGWSKKIQYIDSFGRECQLDSTWEWKMANELDKAGIKWKRAYHFWIGGGSSYTPDFFLPDFNLYLDPKAWKNPEQMVRIDKWLKIYNKNFLIIDKYENLNWEYVKKEKGL